MNDLRGHPASLESGQPIKIIRLRYQAECRCGTLLPAGSRASWDRAARRATCLPCLESAGHAVVVPAAIDPGVAGASLQREYERRSAARSTRIRAAHPRLGGLMLALSSEPQTTEAFNVGAIGERRAAAKIIERAGSEALFLLNRSLGAGRRDGDVDMVVVGPSGVYIVDVKNYSGAVVTVRRTGGLVRPAREQLMVGSRDRTKLLISLNRQVAAVRLALASFPGGSQIPVSAAFCFLAGLPLFGTPRINGFPLLTVKGSARHVVTPGGLDAAARASLHAHLAQRLPVAV